MTELMSRNQGELGARAMYYSRTGQYENAERDLAGVRKSDRSAFSFVEFYYLYWRRKFDAMKSHYSEHEFGKLEPLYKYWVCFLLGDIEGGIDHLEEDVSRGAHPAVFRSNIGELLPQSLLRQVDKHPRYQAILKGFGIDDTWRDELMVMANGLSGVTGIHVQADDAY